MKLSEGLRYNADGLVTAVVQDAATDQVLMVAHMNRDAVDRTVETGRATYSTRSRQKLWGKGESSGHFQYVNEIYVDCDAHALVLRCEQMGAACPDRVLSSFYRPLTE